jgi:hypothetical protein
MADKKTNYPDSDESARHTNPPQDDEMDTNPNDAVPGLQVSGKSGKHSTTEKLAASRPNFGTGRGAEPVDGASGTDDATAVAESDMGTTPDHRSINEHKKARPGA